MKWYECNNLRNKEPMRVSSKRDLGTLEKCCICGRTDAPKIYKAQVTCLDQPCINENARRIRAKATRKQMAKKKAEKAARTLQDETAKQNVENLGSAASDAACVVPEPRKPHPWVYRGGIAGLVD